MISLPSYCLLEEFVLERNRTRKPGWHHSGKLVGQCSSPAEFPLGKSGKLQPWRTAAVDDSYSAFKDDLTGPSHTATLPLQHLRRLVVFST